MCIESLHIRPGQRLFLLDPSRFVLVDPLSPTNITNMEETMSTRTKPMSDSAFEKRLRRHAALRGMRVTKSRRLSGWGESVGYFMVDPSTNLLLSSECGMDMEELADWLAERELGW